MRTQALRGRRPRRAGERRPSEHLPPPSGPALRAAPGAQGPAGGPRGAWRPGPGEAWEPSALRFQPKRPGSG